MYFQDPILKRHLLQLSPSALSILLGERRASPHAGAQVDTIPREKGSFLEGTERGAESKCTPSLPPPRSRDPVYLSRPGVRGLARANVRVPQRQEAGGGAALGPHRGRLAAAHQEGRRVPARPQHSSHRLSGFSLGSTCSTASSPLGRLSTEQEGRGNFRNTGFASSAGTRTCQRGPPALLRSVQNPRKRNARLGVLFIPWLGLGTSGVGLVEPGHRRILGFAAVSSLGSAPHPSLGGEARESQSRDGWAVSHGKRAGPFPRAKVQLHNNPTDPASPYALHHNSPAAEVQKGVPGRAKHTAMASSLTPVMSWPRGHGTCLSLSSLACTMKRLPAPQDCRKKHMSCSQRGVTLPSARKHLADSGDFPSCHNRWWGDYHRAGTDRPGMPNILHRSEQLLIAKNYPAKNVNNAKAEKAWGQVTSAERHLAATAHRLP